MRISDWSSDVCSSDLVDALVGEEPAGWLVVPPANDAAAAKPKRAPENEPEPFPLPAALQRHETPEATEPKGPVVFPDDWNEFQNWQIGRASCRERVSQYV